MRVAPSPSEKVHEVIQGEVASVMLFSQGLSKLGSSPTRMGEILGCGLPVVANDGVDDVALIIQQYRVVVLVEWPEPECMLTALKELDELLLDIQLAARCRAAAAPVFSLDERTKVYNTLYKQVIFLIKYSHNLKYLTRTSESLEKSILLSIKNR